MVGFLNDQSSHANDLSESGFFITNMKMPALNNRFASVGRISAGLDQLNHQLRKSEASHLIIQDCGDCGTVELEEPEYVF